MMMMMMILMLVVSLLSCKSGRVDSSMGVWLDTAPHASDACEWVLCETPRLTLTEMFGGV